MFIEYNASLKQVARDNRNNPTKAEIKTWEEVLSKKQTGYLFLRQKIIDNFILDFYCSNLLLAIEIDGSVHDNKQQKDNDKIRTEMLDILGIKVIRYTNSEVINNMDFVCKDIMKKMNIRKIELNKLSPLDKGGLGDLNL